MALPPVTFPTLGWQVIDWIEAYLPHGPGDIQGDRIVMDDEMALHICWLYRVFPQDHAQAGMRMIHRGILSRPKGRAKSEQAGMLVCAEALGPVRFGGWDAKGEPVGVRIQYPYIRCLATEEGQAGNTYDNVKYMLEHGEVNNVYAVDTGLSRTFIREVGGGGIFPSTASSSAKDGGKESFVVADETHLYVTPELRKMYRTVARNTGKRKDAQPWIYDTTTAWQPGEGSVAEQASERYQVLDLEAQMKAGVLYDHRQGDEPNRFNDDRSLAKALRSGYGPAAAWMNFDRIVKIIRDAEDPEEEAYRYWLNRPRVSADQWVMPDIIKEQCQEFSVPYGSMACFGFDGSESDDHTALMGCTENGDIFTVGVWTPTKAESFDWKLDVTKAVEWVFDNFKVIRFYGDPPYWTSELAEWASKHDEITEFWTSGETKMAAASGALRGAINRKECRINTTPMYTEPILKEKLPIVQWHFNNCKRRKVRVKMENNAEEAYIVRKDRHQSPRKIDSVTSSIVARRARDDAMKNGEFVVPEYSSAVW